MRRCVPGGCQGACQVGGEGGGGAQGRGEGGGGVPGEGGGGRGEGVRARGGCQVMGKFCNYRIDMLKRLSNGSIANRITTPPPSIITHILDLFIVFQMATLEEVAADVIIVGIQAAQNISIKVNVDLSLFWNFKTTSCEAY